MSDSIREAAERLRTLVDDYDEIEGTIAGELLLEEAASLGLTVARAWLAEHPSDSELAIDEAWLRSVGFETCPNTDFVQSPRSAYGAQAVVKIDGNHKGAVIVASDVANSYPGSAPVGKDWTRGQLRVLTKSLGITLKEPA